MDRSDNADLHHLADEPRTSAGKGNAIGLRSKVATEVAAALRLTADEKESLRWKSITGYNEAFSAARRWVLGTVQ